MINKKGMDPHKDNDHVFEILGLLIILIIVLVILC